VDDPQTAFQSPMASEYNQLIRDFNRIAMSMGYDDITNYWWYHTIDLGNGLITPGYYDYRKSVSDFRFPAMEGMSVLEVGSATGFFAFEFEKMGANVTSVELPSLEDVDRFPGETLARCLNKFQDIIRKTEELLSVSVQHHHLYRSKSPEQLYHYFFDGPFRFCHEILKSRVRRCYSTIYDLSKENLGREEFDLVFLGDILLHTLYPLKALAAAAAVCRRTMIIAQVLRGPDEAPPAMIYIGGDEIGQDTGAWWLPNRLCLEQMLKKLGFADVTMVGTHAGVIRPSGERFERAVIHANR
jgi:hypothetical protein